jgi:hypothetical protein
MSVSRIAQCLTLFCALASCAVPRATPQAAPEPSSARVWEYEVRAGSGARELQVRVKLPPGVPPELQLDRYADPFLRDLELRARGGWSRVPSSGGRWSVPECRAAGCELRYRYLLGEAAAEIDRSSFAALRGGLLLAPPSTWLLHPRDYSGRDLYRLRVSERAEASFASGVWLSGAGDGSREAPAELLFQAPYSAFGRFRRERVEVPGGVIYVSIGLDGGELALSAVALRAALSSAASVLTSYFGRFPVKELALIIVPVAGTEASGMQLGNGGASILLFLGREARDLSPQHDWVLVHEMFHLALPSLLRRHLWLAEGLATYQEPLARARAGFIDEQQLWREFLQGLPKGLPGPRDHGLDGTRSWGRTYWGGALFCLLADLTIRSSSAQRYSLDDALRGILDAGGDTSVRWTAQQTLAAGDRAIHGRTLQELYRAHADAAVSIDLEAVFRRLGVGWSAGQVVFDESAEWAGLRRALAAPASARAGRTAQGLQLGLASPGVPKSPL